MRGIHGIRQLADINDTARLVRGIMHLAFIRQEGGDIVDQERNEVVLTLLVQYMEAPISMAQAPFLPKVMFSRTTWLAQI